MTDEPPAFNLPEFYTNSISVAQPNILAYYRRNDFKEYHSTEEYINSLKDFASKIDNTTVIVTLSASLYGESVNALQNICSPGFPVISEWKILCHETFQFQPQSTSHLIIYSPGRGGR